MNLRQLLSDRFVAAFAAAGFADAQATVQPAGKPEFGDYQVNGAMALAKRAGTNPRELATRVVELVDQTDLIERLEVAGPGFINVTLSERLLTTSVSSDRELLTPTTTPETVVVDYSAPNLAKEMHVGHLRSTIIGDAIARVLEALGNRVIRQNHVGDWGTQFGMLLTYLNETGDASDALADIEDFYRAAKSRFDSDPEFASRARRTVVDLQSGEASATAAWQKFIAISLSHCQATYDRLGTTLTMDDVKAESAYNDALPGIINSLRERNMLVESDGAQCVFLDEFKGKDGKPLGIIVQKSDGGFLYTTTDLAAIRHRSFDLHADRVIYLTDARQSQHFQQVYQISRWAGFAPPEIRLEHQPFGNMLGKDGKPFKTRDGGVVKLNDLLDEAIVRAYDLISSKAPDIPESERREIARVVGIGAVKYADLSKNRTSNYIFDWDQMLSLQGNTAPYLLYAYTRIRSIFERGEVAAEQLSGTVQILDPTERSLCLILLQFQEVVEQVAAEVYPHFLCGYLYDLATAFMRFYEACPILNEKEQTRVSRLLLCDRTARTLRTGLDLLGIETVDRM
jgi:arginyl-tRNA synthetase